MVEGVYGAMGGGEVGPHSVLMMIWPGSEVLPTAFTSLVARVIRTAFGVDVRIACTRKLTVSNLIVGIGLLIAPAFGQQPSRTVVAQITGFTPPAGVLITPQ